MPSRVAPVVHCLSGLVCGRLLRCIWTRSHDVPSGRAPAEQRVHGHQPSAAGTSSAVGTPTVISSGSRMLLEVLYISGATVATLDACSNWTGADLKRILQPFLQKGVAIAGIINEGTAIEDTQTLEEAGVKSGQLYLMPRSCTYLIEDAGAEVVNGYYVQKEGELNKSPVYANEAGILLFKYKMARGSEYWYLSRDGDLSRSDGDYYRVRSNSKRPPEEGWSWEACPLGRRTMIPTLTYFGSDKASTTAQGIPELRCCSEVESLQDLGGFCSSSTASGEAQSASDTSD